MINDGMAVSIVKGPDAVLSAYAAVGLGWLVALLRTPLFRWLVAGAYAIISRHRHTISRWMPGGRQLAAAAAAANNLTVAEPEAEMAQCDTDCELPFAAKAEEETKKSKL